MTQTNNKTPKKVYPPSPLAKANEVIVKAVGRTLVEYQKAERMGAFKYQHQEMAEVRNLITDYQILAYSKFTEFNKMADWLARVSKVLPYLYD
jgi:hypothetical protein